MISTLLPNLTLNSPGKVILTVGLLTGLLDATAGVIVYLAFKGLNPIQVLQYIASGAFGPTAFDGGLLMALVGMGFHFLISFAFATAFFIFYPWVPILSKKLWVSGLVYGSLVWVFMNYIILPNSNIPHSPKDFVSVIELVWHAVLVGLPTLLITNRYYITRKTQ